MARRNTRTRPAERWSARVAGWVSWALLGVGLILGWPTTLGGATGYVVVSGHSMEPTYVTGDLVVTRTDVPVRPGEVIVYTVADQELGAGMAVVHRVLRPAADGGWVTQGDNNDSVDPWHPTKADITGTVVAHLPKVGYLLTYARSPLVLAFIGAVIVGWILWPKDGAEDEDEPGLGSAGQQGAAAPAAGTEPTAEPAPTAPAAA